MQRTWQAEVSQAKTEQREPVMPRFVPTDDSVRQVASACVRRFVRAEKRARLAARPALGVIAFLCWATKRHMQVNVEVTER
jgi:hypothetical protein